MAARKTKGATLTEIRHWPAAVDVTQAATALGISRASAYQAIASGEFPAATIRVNRRLKVLTADLVRVLEGPAAQRVSA
jgi:Helix-turn-helix domain